MFDRFKKRGKFDPIAASEQVAALLPMEQESARRRMLDVLLGFGIPFNRWLGLRIKEFTKSRVVIESPPTVLRRNHVGTAHACAQALIGEYAAGLVVAQTYPIESYRIIIGKLEIEYHKAGAGTLLGVAEAPEKWAELNNNEAWVEMVTHITNEKGESVSTCRTRWQVKSWDQVKSRN